METMMTLKPSQERKLDWYDTEISCSEADKALVLQDLSAFMNRLGGGPKDALGAAVGPNHEEMCVAVHVEIPRGCIFNETLGIGAGSKG